MLCQHKPPKHPSHYHGSCLPIQSKHRSCAVVMHSTAQQGGDVCRLHLHAALPQQTACPLLSKQHLFHRHLAKHSTSATSHQACQVWWIIVLTMRIQEGTSTTEASSRHMCGYAAASCSSPAASRHMLRKHTYQSPHHALINGATHGHCLRTGNTVGAQGLHASTADS